MGPKGVGFVSLVGAGPGDPDLLTMRAVKRLAEADVVAYDLLIPQAVLDLAPARAERIAVGRRVGAPHSSVCLHPVVIQRARAGLRVVRLKSGDPCIFGRAGEEAEALVRAGIPYEIVPGISAALGAAAATAIPLTHRDHASAVTFVTGHGAHNGTYDIARSALEGTLVLYMGARRLGENLRRLVQSGRAATTPAAYVAAATWNTQQVVVGTLDTLPAKVAARNIDPDLPALVIVGDVVSVRAQLHNLAPARATTSMQATAPEAP